MKKLVSAVLSTAVLVSAISGTLTAGAVYDPSNVGTITSVPDRFEGKQDQLTQKYKEAYDWAVQLSAKDPKDGKFDFGNTTGEYLHAWSGTDTDENAYEICNQDFDGGNSSAANAFSYKNWCAILCADEETLNVVIVRDAVAEMYAKGGGVNNLQFGNPVTNQYWRMEDGDPVLYQQFENGYFRAVDGETWYGDFYNIVDEGANYVEPPEAPPAYGDIYAVNADGCSWENPENFPPDVEKPADQTSLPVGGGNGGGGAGGTGDGDDNIVDPIVGGGDTQTGETPDASNASGTSDTASTVDTADGSEAAGTASGTSSGSKNTNTNNNDDDKATTAGSGGKVMNVPATVGLIAGGVVVVGGGVFCLYWFVLRKKKVADGADAEEGNSEAEGENKTDEK